MSTPDFIELAAFCVKYIFNLLVLCILLCANSCTTNSKEHDWMTVWESKAHPEFDKERPSIYFKEERRQDIKAEITIPLGSHDIVCEFSFFNYGEDIRLYKGCIDDAFITGIGTINYVRDLKHEDRISLESKRYSEKYGDWAIVNVIVDNNYVDNVFLTPLAMNAYMNRNDEDKLIFIQFVNCNKLMNVIFCGSIRETRIVRYCPNSVLRKSDLSYNIDASTVGPGQFWHKIE